MLVVIGRYQNRVHRCGAASLQTGQGVPADPCPLLNWGIHSTRMHYGKNTSQGKLRDALELGLLGNRGSCHLLNVTLTYTTHLIIDADRVLPVMKQTSVAVASVCRLMHKLVQEWFEEQKSGSGLCFNLNQSNLCGVHWTNKSDDLLLTPGCQTPQHTSRGLMESIQQQVENVKMLRYYFFSSLYFRSAY